MSTIIPQKTITLDFCVLEFYDHFVVSTIDEGVMIDLNAYTKIFEQCLYFFGTNPFSYISNRLRSFSVNPMVYKHVSSINNLKSFAVVSKNAISLECATIEKLFFKKSFEIFSDLELAKAWSLSEIFAK